MKAVNSFNTISPAFSSFFLTDRIAINELSIHEIMFADLEKRWDLRILDPSEHLPK
jgi:hypothetical protein